eukprot:6970364-Prymnesium_polylepis.1
MSARLTAKKYLPTALISKQLPAGLSDMRTVPRLKAPDEWNAWRAVGLDRVSECHERERGDQWRPRTQTSTSVCVNGSFNIRTRQGGCEQ